MYYDYIRFKSRFITVSFRNLIKVINYTRAFERLVDMGVIALYVIRSITLYKQSPSKRQAEENWLVLLIPGKT